MAGEDLVELKFRLADGSDIGPSKYSPATTVASLKEKILAQWPRDKENCPKTIQDVKLINAGKILENNRTLAESRLLVGELPGGVITMHVVLRLPLSDKNNGNPEDKYLIHCMWKRIVGYDKQQNDSPKKSSCACTIL
ncbi:membrane-anchored ubiquitin-fold protein 6 isoform X1 [Herrania umbratica]|uniref:Membrane-anchored ubiquitin-fold protein 6 isoform X1 n=1 Tax=Herrania umbratica TaxID=108875 RepID=A0A6J1AEZ9_9ROSI|nr:membrane-anchored ubiquitin-fold protein 6 isoform X1 [Herrania umbratica]